MSGGIIAFLTALFGMALELFKEYFSAQARVRQANEQFQLDQKKFNEIVQNVLNRRQQSDAKDSAQAGDIWEIADQNIQKGTGTEGSPASQGNKDASSKR